MGIRETMNENPRLTVGIVCTIALVATGFVVMQVLAGRRTFPSKSPNSFYTIDDGKTFFVASSDNIPPFEHEGKQAVHAIVFECSGKQFVGYLERYTPESRQAILAGKGSPTIETYGRELKKPGGKVWVKSGNLAAEDPITNQIQCPAGISGVPERVEP
jgi:hypothetical protein